MVEIDIDNELKKLEVERDHLIEQVKILDEQKMRLMLRIEQINGIINYLKSMKVGGGEDET